MTGVGDYFRTAEAVPFHEAQWAKAQMCARYRQTRRGKLQRLEAVALLPLKSAPFDFAQGRLSGTHALPVKKIGYDYGIMTIV